MPELYRVKAALLQLPQAGTDDAELWLTRSLELGRRQGAPAWELRTAIDLVALWVAQGRTTNARALLQPLRDKFVDGSDIGDLKNAEQLLAALR